MRIIKSDSLPRLWWLNPWAAAKYLHSAATAMKDYADRVDRVLDIQRSLIEEQAAEIRLLKARVADQNDAIIRGVAITPDATPYRDDTIHE